MRSLSTAEVARMTTTQGESFNDQVTLYGYPQGQDSLGQLMDSYDSGSLIDCGFLTQAQMLNERGQVVTIDADAVMRVAAGQIVDLKDKVIGRGVTYYVDGVQPGRHVHIVALKEIRI
jgi:hypothetical protein